MDGWTGMVDTCVAETFVHPVTTTKSADAFACNVRCSLIGGGAHSVAHHRHCTAQCLSKQFDRGGCLRDIDAACVICHGVCVLVLGSMSVSWTVRTENH